MAGTTRSLSSYKQRDMNLSLGRRFNANKVGAIFSVSSSGTERGNEDFEPVYTSGNLSRSGSSPLRRHPPSDGHDRGASTSGPCPVRNTRFEAFTTTTSTITRNDSVSVNASRIVGSSGSCGTGPTPNTSGRRLSRGQHQIGRASVDFRLSGAHADQKDPLTIATTFRQSNVNFAPNVTPSSIDPDNVQANPLNESLTAYTFNQQVRATNYAGERDIVGSADARFNAASTSSVASFFKFGLKYRDKEKNP